MRPDITKVVAAGGRVGGRFHHDARYPALPGRKLFDHGGDEDDGFCMLQ
jgi:hypothetical protein